MWFLSIMIKINGGFNLLVLTKCKIGHLSPKMEGKSALDHKFDYWAFRMVIFPQILNSLLSYIEFVPDVASWTWNQFRGILPNIFELPSICIPSRQYPSGPSELGLFADSKPVEEMPQWMPLIVINGWCFQPLNVITFHLFTKDY